MRLQPNWKLGVSFLRRSGSATCARRCFIDMRSPIAERRFESRKIIGPSSSLNAYCANRLVRSATGWRA
jgi:hypothetical protein